MSAESKAAKCGHVVVYWFLSVGSNGALEVCSRAGSFSQRLEFLSEIRDVEAFTSKLPTQNRFQKIMGGACSVLS